MCEKFEQVKPELSSLKLTSVLLWRVTTTLTELKTFLLCEYKTNKMTNRHKTVTMSKTLNEQFGIEFTQTHLSAVDV